MRKKLGPIGFDLSIDRLNIMQIEKKRNGYKIHAAASILYPTDYDALIASPKGFRTFVRRALKTKPFKGKKIVTCLSSNKIQIVNLSYKLPSGQNEAETVIKEVASQLDGAIDDYVIDYLPIRVEVEDPTEKKALMAVCKRDDVISYLELLTKSGLDVFALDIGPAALRRLVVSLDYENKYPTVLLLNFGRASSYLTVLSGRRLMIDEKMDFGEDKLVDHLCKSLMMDRKVDFGENRLITQLSKAFQTEENHAKKLLYEYGFGNGNGVIKSTKINRQDITRAIKEILNPLFLELANEVNKVLIYTASETRGRSIERIYLLGSVARYPGAACFISDMLSIPCEVLNPFARFSTSDCNGILEDINPVAGIALATGLALRGIYSYD